MKGISLIAVAAVLAATSASAADLKGKKRVADLPEAQFAEPAPLMNWSGFYITGKLGVAEREYEVERNAKGEAGTYGTPDPVTGDIPELSYMTYSGRHNFDLSEDQELDAEIELSYLQRLGRATIEPFVSASMPINSDGVKHAYEYDVTLNETGTIVGEGFFEAEKRFDAFAGLKVGGIVADRVYAFAGAGAGYGQFKVRGGGNVAGGAPDGPFATPYDDDEGAFGYMIVAGAKYALTSNMLLGIEAAYKEFLGVEAGSSNNVGDPTVDTGYTKATGSHEFDANEWTVKGTLSIKLND